MTDTTPATAEAMSSTKNVKVEIAADKGPGLATHAKLAHVLSVVVAGVIAVAVATVLADGTSVIKLKPVVDLPIATAKEFKSQGLSMRLDQLLGPTYGIGLHHDQAGYSWTEIGAGSSLSSLLAELGTPAVIAAVPYVISIDSLKHPVPFLSCDDLQKAGMAAMGLGFIAESVAVIMVIFHSLVLAGLLPSKIAKPLGGLIWLVLTAGFLIVVALAIGIYNSTWECANPVIPSIKLYEHFNYNYGFAFAIIGFLSSLLIFVVTMCCTSMKDGTDDAPGFKGASSVLKLLCGVLGGVGVLAVVIVIVCGANGVFAEPAPVDESINPCEGKKPYHAGPNDHYFSNTECTIDAVTQTLEQAGANVTKGYKGLMDAGSRVPITTPYDQTDLCPVNVHWHLGAEHLSVGQFDEHGHGPHGDDHHRALGENIRLGFQCHHYKADDPKFTTPYDWKHCTNMEIGQTYEIHWPHSAAGACGTKWQMQTPFYDGVFCKDGIIEITPLNTYEKIGVQSQVYTVVNDDDPALYYPDLIKGMIMGGADSTFGADIAKYTGSTTGTSRDNTICSRYTPITWQVDRKCHLISASSFDKLCADMAAQADDMSGDFYPHGARELVASHLVADNQQSRKK